MPKFYFDIGKEPQYAKIGQTPFTPAVSLYYGLDLALEMMEDEGLEQTQRAPPRRRRLHARQGARRSGLQLLAEGPQASDTVTSVRVPEGVDAASCWRC